VLDDGDDAVEKLELQTVRDQSIVDATKAHMENTGFLEKKTKKTSIRRIANYGHFMDGKTDSSKLQTSKALM